jgi:hypothetical protein
MEKNRTHGAARGQARRLDQISLLHDELGRLIGVAVPASRAWNGGRRRVHGHANAKRTRAPIPTTTAVAICNWRKAAVALFAPSAIRPPLHCRPNVVRLHTSTAIFDAIDFCGDMIPAVHANLCATGITGSIPVTARHVLAKRSPRHQTFATLLPYAIGGSFIGERARGRHRTSDRACFQICKFPAIRIPVGCVNRYR